eukprot:scaffold4.g4630.t1
MQALSLGRATVDRRLASPASANRLQPRHCRIAAGVAPPVPSPKPWRFLPDNSEPQARLLRIQSRLVVAGGSTPRRADREQSFKAVHKLSADLRPQTCSRPFYWYATAPCVQAQPAPATPRGPAAAAAPAGRKARVVVLGSGWGAVSFIKNAAPEAFGPDGPYELVVVSPRNYFCYTPLLPAAAAGAIEERSIVEPIRELLARKGSFVEASVTNIDAARQTLRCRRQHCDVCETKGKAFTCTECEKYQADFDLTYDVLIMSVGARNATFGIKGVRDEMVERAATPTCTPEEQRRLLSVVVVGGGPTGVEAAAEMQDLIREDIARLLPQLKARLEQECRDLQGASSAGLCSRHAAGALLASLALCVARSANLSSGTPRLPPGRLQERPTVTLITDTDVVLKQFSPSVGVHATQHLQRSGIGLLLGHVVTEVGDGQVTVKNRSDDSTSTLPYGTCLWSAGITTHPLVASLRSQLPPMEQTARRGLLVDGHLRVRGAPSIFAVGDAAATAEAPADQLPATAQVARQQAEFLARLFNTGSVFVDAAPTAPACASACNGCGPAEQACACAGAAAGAADEPAADGAQTAVRLAATAKPFHYTHLGQVAYIGGESGIVDLPVPNIVPPAARAIKGMLASLAWRGMESWMQVSLRNQVMVVSDMVRTKLFGRNVSSI